jgi:hypothetical protein
MKLACPRITYSRRMRWTGIVARIGTRATRIGYRLENQKKSRSLRSRRRWVDNIKMDLVETRCGAVDWIGFLAGKVHRCDILVSYYRRITGFVVFVHRTEF